MQHFTILKYSIEFSLCIYFMFSNIKKKILLGGKHKAYGQSIHKRSFEINMHTKGFLCKNILNNCLDP